MPLIHSKSDDAFKKNVSTLMGEVGKSPHVQSREQALAIAYATKRRGKADGGTTPPDPDAQKILDQAKMQNLMQYYLGRKTREGRVDGGRTPGFALGGAPAPWFVRNEARSMMHSGPVMSAVPGRTDKHNISVAAGSYVLPADHVSSLGQGNTQAGFATLGRMFGKPMAIPHGHPPPPPRFAPMKMAGFGKRSDEGGSRGDEAGGPVPIVVAGGEFVIPPDKVAEIDGGDLKRGHEVLDHWVKTNREKHIKTLKGLPPPARK